jgi:hypothetical protein
VGGDGHVWLYIRGDPCQFSDLTGKPGFNVLEDVNLLFAVIKSL